MIYYFERQLEELNRSVHSLDEEVFKKWVNDAVETLKKGHKIIATGLGKNVPICEKFVGTMVSLGLNACFLHTNSAVHGDLGIVKDGDMVILLTKSGETAESVCLTGYLNKRDVSIWLLTFEKESTLVKEIPNSVILDLQNEGDLWNIMPNNSTTINLIILQGLAMNIATAMNLSVNDFKRNHPGGAIGNSLRFEYEER